MAPACPGTGTTGVDAGGAATTTGVDAAGVAMTAGPDDAPASLGLATGVTLGTGTTAGGLLAGQFLTVGAQLVTISPTVL